MYQGNQLVDEEKFCIEEFQLMNVEEMTELEKNHHFLIVKRKKDLDSDHQWIPSASGQRLMGNFITEPGCQHPNPSISVS